jgi:hypothetical protein
MPTHREASREELIELDVNTFSGLAHAFEIISCVFLAGI